jgi:hypothetical protein
MSEAQERSGGGYTTTVLKLFEFRSAQLATLRKWHRLQYGTTITDRRTLCQTFLEEAIKNQWNLVDQITRERNA